MSHHIRLNSDQMRELKKLHQLSDIELAKRIGVNRQTLHRAMGGAPVSAGFVAGACLYFRTPFETLFEATLIDDETAA